MGMSKAQQVVHEAQPQMEAPRMDNQGESLDALLAAHNAQNQQKQQ